MGVRDIGGRDGGRAGGVAGGDTAVSVSEAAGEPTDGDMESGVLGVVEEEAGVSFGREQAE